MSFFNAYFSAHDGRGDAVEVFYIQKIGPKYRYLAIVFNCLQLYIGKIFSFQWNNFFKHFEKWLFSKKNLCTYSNEIETGIFPGIGGSPREVFKEVKEKRLILLRSLLKSAVLLKIYVSKKKNCRCRDISGRSGGKPPGNYKHFERDLFLILIPMK